MIRGDDGQFAIDCWQDPDSKLDPDATEYSDNLLELQSRAEKILSAGRYRYILLYRWNADEQEWDELETLEVR